MYRIAQVGLVVFLLGAAAAAPVVAAPAGTVVGNGTPLSCTAANVTAAVSAGGTVTFDCGGPLTIQLTSPAGVSHDTTLDGGGVITLTGNLATQLITVSPGIHLALKNIILDKGFANHNSGGAIVNTGSLTLDNVTIQNSIAGQQGGAIWTSGPVTLRNSHLTNNSAKSGGGITVQNPTPLIIDSSTLSGNTAQDNSVNGVGGAIQLGAGAQLTVTGGSLTSNQAVYDGGALHMDANSSALFMPGSAGDPVISYNHTQAAGGALSNNGGRLILQDADLEYNQVPTTTQTYGGAIDNEGAMVMVNSRVANNQGAFGGGIFVGGTIYSATAAITHTEFFANTAGQLGGGLYTNVGGTVLTIEDSRFEFNQAVGGGGLARTNATLTIDKSSFTSNQAQAGGGLYLWAVPHPSDGPYVEVRDTTLSNNLATVIHSGGLNNIAQVNLQNVTIKDNHYGLFTDVGAITRMQGTVLDNPGGANCSTAGPLVSSGGHNFDTDNSCGLTGFQDQQGDAKLGPLASAPLVFTSFHLPQAGSPLLGQAGPGCAASDQRYALRVGTCDIGAIQLHGLLPRLFLPLVRR